MASWRTLNDESTDTSGRRSSNDAITPPIGSPAAPLTALASPTVTRARTPSTTAGRGSLNAVATAGSSSVAGTVVTSGSPSPCGNRCGVGHGVGHSGHELRKPGTPA